MENDVLISLLAVDIPKWKKLVAAIEKEELIQGEDKLFISLRDFWKKNNFAPDICKQLLNEITAYKNKHPPSDLKENLMEFRGLCNKYYTKERDVFEAFQKALGGTRSPEQSPQPRPRPQPQPYPEPKPKPREEEYNHPKKKSKKWILAIVVPCFIMIAVNFFVPKIINLIENIITESENDEYYMVAPNDIEEYQSKNTTAEKGVIINGVRWATRNVDAPGTFAANPEDAGMFYQWNRRIGWSSTDPMVASNGSTKWDASVARGETWEKSNDPCPVGWRVPTSDEIQILFDKNKVSSEWTTVKGVKGRKFTDKATGKSIFLPAAGYGEFYKGFLHEVGVFGNYWSSSIRNDEVIDCVLILRLSIDYASFAFWTERARWYGGSVRPVAE